MAHNSPVLGSASGSGTSSNSGFHVPNFQLGDTTFTKLFVGGLAWETQNESLRRHFEQHGHILEAVVIADKRTGRSKGYGFVTFADPESARRACEDPTPVIDGRRTNCNLASLGRHQAAPSYAHPRLMDQYFGGVPVPRSAFVGISGYYQPILYDYQQRFTYPPYGYMMYGTQQNIHGTSGAQFVQAGRVSGTVNQSTYSPGQFSQPLAGRYDYSMIPCYEMPSNQFLQIRGPYISGASAEPVPVIQAPYSPGIAGQAPAQPWSAMVPIRPPHFTPDQISSQMED